MLIANELWLRIFCKIRNVSIIDHEVAGEGVCRLTSTEFNSKQNILTMS